ncbi:hypothetical protein D3C72_2463540 [compost metagenome]
MGSSIQLLRVSDIHVAHTARAAASSFRPVSRRGHRDPGPQPSDSRVMLPNSSTMLAKATAL